MRLLDHELVLLNLLPAVASRKEVFARRFCRSVERTRLGDMIRLNPLLLGGLDHGRCITENDYFWSLVGHCIHLLSFQALFASLAEEICKLPRPRLRSCAPRHIWRLFEVATS